MTLGRRSAFSSALRSARASVALAVVVLAVAACGGPVLANPPAAHPPTAPEPPASSRPADPVTIAFPRDDGPHDRLTEWWYDTGHLRAADGRRFGFELVVFRAERGGFPVSWASHLALTDETGGRFHYAQRSEIGPQVDRSPHAGGVPTGFALSLDGADPTTPAGATGAANPAGTANQRAAANPATPWTMAGAGGSDALSASASGAEVQGDAIAAFGLDLRLAALKAPALHDTDGYVDFGPGGGSYYYSRTAMDASGTVSLGGETLQVTGVAWFDHQWGDFISVGGGGWDWFALNLDDGTDVTLSLVRAPDGTYPLAYGTLVDAGGTARRIGAADFSVAVTAHWTSSATGAAYPSGWTVRLPGEGLVIELAPTVAAQELDTRATTGVVYWEGSQRVRATRAGTPFGGEGYVELTGYPPAR